MQLVHEDVISLPLTRVLELAAALEAHSSHPMAAAIIGYCAAQGVNTSLAATHVEALTGLGISGMVDGHLVVVGSARLAESVIRGTSGASCSRVSVDDQDRDAQMRVIGAAIEQWAGRGATVSVVVVDGRLAGVVAAQDRPRAGVADVVAQLKKKGVECAMLTGDLRATALSVAHQLGLSIDHTHAGLMPKDKVTLVQAYRKQKRQDHGPVVLPDSNDEIVGVSAPGSVVVMVASEKKDGAAGDEDKAKWFCCLVSRSAPTSIVAHVGDGINDAPALAAADVGVGMGSGTALAVEAADVVVFGGDLAALGFARDLGRRVTRVITANIVFSMVAKVTVLVLALMGYVTLWLSVLADVGSALLVTLHALTVLRYKAWSKPKAAECVSKTQACARPATAACAKPCCDKKLAAAPVAAAVCPEPCCDEKPAAAPVVAATCPKPCCGTTNGAATTVPKPCCAPAPPAPPPPPASPLSTVWTCPRPCCASALAFICPRPCCRPAPGVAGICMRLCCS